MQTALICYTFHKSFGGSLEIKDFLLNFKEAREEIEVEMDDIKQGEINKQRVGLILGTDNG